MLNSLAGRDGRMIEIDPVKLGALDEVAQALGLERGHGGRTKTLVPIIVARIYGIEQLLGVLDDGVYTNGGYVCRGQA